MPEDVKVQETSNTKEKPDSNVDDAAESSDKEHSFSKIDADKIVKPYLARITKEQAQKNDYKSKYENALKELNNLKSNGGKSAKEITEEEKHQQEMKALSEENAALKAQIAHNNSVKEVSNIFKDADLNVDDDILNMVVNKDSKITVSNAKAIINLVNQAHEEGRNTILKGKTPISSGKKLDTKKSFNQMSLLERVELKRKDPARYKEEMKNAGY